MNASEQQSTTESPVDYDHICRIAKRRAAMHPGVDWRDLAQEAVLYGLRGRKSVDGPMQDLLRKKLVGPQRAPVGIVDLEALIGILPDASHSDVAGNEIVTQILYDPRLTSRQRRLLRSILKGDTLAAVARRWCLTQGRVNQILASVRNKLKTPLSLHDLYINQQLTVREIADRIGAKECAVYEALRRYGIDRRPIGRRPASACISCGKPAYDRGRCRFHHKLRHARSVSLLRAKRSQQGQLLSRGQTA